MSEIELIEEAIKRLKARECKSIEELESTDKKINALKVELKRKAEQKQELKYWLLGGG